MALCSVQLNTTCPQGAPPYGALSLGNAIYAARATYQIPGISPTMIPILLLDCSTAAVFLLGCLSKLSSWKS